MHAAVPELRLRQHADCKAIPTSPITVTDVQDQTAVGFGIYNIYDESVTITGLQPNTTYHWRPLTTDALGNMAAFFDQTFTTAAQ